MPEKPMDFNPLDLLAAAALGQKDGSTDVAESKKGSSSTHNSSQETKDAEEDTDEDMGKTTKINLKSQARVVGISETIMPPQKAPWSPEAFLSPNLEDQVEMKPGKISFIELVQDLKHAAFGKKEKSPFSSDSYKDSSDKINVNNNVICAKNALNLEKDVEASDEFKTNHKEKDSEIDIFMVDHKNTELNSPGENTDPSSDTDTAESSEVVLKCPDSEKPVNFVGMDHSYASYSGQTGSFTESWDEEVDIDVCSQSSPSNEDSELLAQKMSPDCKAEMVDDISVGSLDLCRISSFGRGRLPSSCSSASSPTLEMSLKNGVKEDETESSNLSSSIIPEKSSPDKKTPKFGKFRIGTFASFSSNNLELEKYLRNKDSLSSEGKKLNIGIPSDINLLSSTLISPTASPSLHPLLHSPTRDWDRSEAGSEVQDDSSESRTPQRLSPDFTSEKITEWAHPLFHDHDYCVKEGDSETDFRDGTKLNLAKRKYTKRKCKLDAANHEKIMKAKYLKKELLKQEPPRRATPELDIATNDLPLLKSNPVGRPKKRPLEKSEDEEIDPETGAKMKITGKFQDQYVYYLSKSSRTTSRRRQRPLPFPPDKIVVPAPKPGDIIVPHLTDADIETVRLKGRAALNLSERPQTLGLSDRLSSGGLLSSHHGPSPDYDVDSHIVSTVLSMENDNLSSAPSPTHSDSANAGFNPHQPVLTDCLQMMSGDNSLTSEHVLNFLLSVVKDDDVDHSDNLLNGTTALDSTNSSLFPSLPPDSIQNKVDQSGLSDMLQSKPFSSSSDSPKISSIVNTLSNNTNSHLSDSIFENSNIKEDPDRLPDDLSSFIANSQGASTSSSSTSQSVFGSDLSSLGTPQLSSSLPRLTSVEKTLDYLGVKDGEIKLDQTELLSSKFQPEADSSSLLTPDSVVSSDDCTPWIVTVTLYFNDVPAIMVNNQPFIRLVDIHKQILPAKDTGILKKRCQLLKIPVLNCSEMQRYFLVQYGRAYNSKSTLIISKEQANELVTYYACPQPRNGKFEESSLHGRASGRDSDSSCGLPGVLGKKKTKTDRKNSMDKGPLVAYGSNDRCADQQKDLTSGGIAAVKEELLSKRTRHKKINYLEMLRGEEKKSSEDSISETIECVVKAAPDYVDQLLNTKHQGSSSKQVSKKKFKMNKQNNSKDKKKDSWQKSNNKQHQKARKDKREDSPHEEEKIHIQDNEAWLRKLGDLPSDSEDSLDHVLGKTKAKPLKLKVNSLLNFTSQKKSSSPTKKNGLFSRSNSSASGSSESPLRVLAVAHQAAINGIHSEARLPSQPADIHLDLFIKSSSPCVRCQTCSQFLSVPHFMRHHHVPMDSEWLATEAAHRILVPRNKENISEQEKKLWEEFHALQEAIGGFGERDDDEEEEDSESDSDVDFDVDDDESSLSMSGTSSMLNSGTREQILVEREDPRHSVLSMDHENDSSSSGEEEEESDYTLRPSSDTSTAPLRNILVDQLSQKLKKEMASRCGLVPRAPPPQLESLSIIKKQGDLQNPNLRTSMRKRKSKQFFSIENYYTPKKTTQDDEVCTLTCSADQLEMTEV